MFWFISIGILMLTLVCIKICVYHGSGLAYALAILSALAGGVGNLIYLCSQTNFRGEHILLGVAVVVIPMIVLLTVTAGRLLFIPLILSALLGFVAMLSLGTTASNNNNAAFVDQPVEVECESYELAAASYDSDINGTLTTKYYRRVEGEVREDDLFKFYYIADAESEEMKLMTLNAPEVSLYFVEEGEKPCCKVITINQSGVNSKTGKVEEEVVVRNELSVPSESITPGYDLDVVD